MARRPFRVGGTRCLTNRLLGLAMDDTVRRFA
jgi:hypothetical protein